MDNPTLDTGSLPSRAELPDRPSPRVARTASPRSERSDRPGRGLFDAEVHRPEAPVGPGAVAEGEQVEHLAASLRDALVATLAPEQFQTWFKRSRLIRVDDEHAVVAVPNSFAKEWIAKYYLDVLQRAVDSILGADREVVLVEQPESLVVELPPKALDAPGPAADPAAGPAAGPAADPAAGPARREQQPIRRSQTRRGQRLPVPNPVHLRELRGRPCNRFGHAAALARPSSRQVLQPSLPPRARGPARRTSCRPSVTPSSSGSPTRASCTCPARRS